jgi:Mn2+/Fe2+ NRAMP family transporter
MSARPSPNPSGPDPVVARRAEPELGEGARAAVAPRQRLGLGDVLRIVGPGVVTGSADNDPAGVTTYSVVGAQNGYAQNWLLLLATPLLIAVQVMSAKVGNVTKTDFATVLRLRYGVYVSSAAVLAAVVANLLTMGADLEMLAAVTGLVTGIKFTYFIIPFAALMAYVTIFSDFKRFATILLAVGAVFLAYVVAAFLARPDWSEVLRQTVVPRIDPSPTYFLGAVGLLGTTITPYLFFWQASGEIEERRGVQRMGRTGLDIAVGIVWSNIIAFFILVTTGAVLFTHHASIQTAADAAKALEPLVGPYAKDLFAAGIIGAGLVAIPVLAASTAYSVAGLVGWRRSLNRSALNAPQFYLVLGVAFLVAVQLAISDLDPIKVLFYSQVLDGLIAPVLVALLVLLTTSRRVMGDFANGPLLSALGWLTVLVLLAADAGMVVSVIGNGLPG